MVWIIWCFHRKTLIFITLFDFRFRCVSRDTKMWKWFKRDCNLLIKSHSAQKYKMFLSIKFRREWWILLNLFSWKLQNDTDRNQDRFRLKIKIPMIMDNRIDSEVVSTWPKNSGFGRTLQSALQLVKFIYYEKATKFVSYCQLTSSSQSRLIFRTFQ